jgi:hypothetical protein
MAGLFMGSARSPNLKSLLRQSSQSKIANQSLKAINKVEPASANAALVTWSRRSQELRGARYVYPTPRM